MPDWTAGLDDTAVAAACLPDVLGELRRNGWVRDIPRLIALGNYALQRGTDPSGDDRVVPRDLRRRLRVGTVANVVGMSQHADGGVLATKPYASGGA